MASSLYSEEDVTEIYYRHVETVYRVCFSFMKNAADTEDLVQETFLKLIACKKRFQSENHEKAWLIVTASNACKDALRRWGHTAGNVEDYQLGAEEAGFPEDNPVLEAILELPEKYRMVVYLYYYEGYNTAEIAKMLKCSSSTVRNRLTRARKRLKKYME